MSEPGVRGVSVYLRLVAAMVFWGGTFVAARQIAAQMAPESAAFLRFLIASLVLLPLLVLQEGRLPRLDRRQLIAVLLLGATGVFAYNLFFFSALRSVEAGRAALIIATNPVFIVLIAALLFGERFNLRQAAGVMLSVVGAMWVISRGDPHALLQGQLGVGELYLLGCVASWVAYTLIGKRVLAGLTPLAAVTYSCIAGALLLLYPALGSGLAALPSTLTIGQVMGLFYLAVFGTVLGFVWFYQGVRTIGAARAGLFISLVPVIGISLGVLLLGEQPGASLLGGGVLVIGGLLLANR